MTITIEEIQDVVDELENVHTKRIRAEAMLEKEMEILAEHGYASIKEGTKAMEKLSVKISKRKSDLMADFKDFMGDYEELFA